MQSTSQFHQLLSVPYNPNPTLSYNFPTETSNNGQMQTLIEQNQKTISFLASLKLTLESLEARMGRLELNHMKNFKVDITGFQPTTNINSRDLLQQFIRKLTEDKEFKEQMVS
jgi:hypothetical protein